MKKIKLVIIAAVLASASSGAFAIDCSQAKLSDRYYCEIQSQLP